MFRYNNNNNKKQITLGRLWLRAILKIYNSPNVRKAHLPHRKQDLTRYRNKIKICTYVHIYTTKKEKKKLEDYNKKSRKSGYIKSLSVTLFLSFSLSRSLFRSHAAMFVFLDFSDDSKVLRVSWLSIQTHTHSLTYTYTQQYRSNCFLFDYLSTANMFVYGTKKYITTATINEIDVVVVDNNNQKQQ